MIDNFNNMGGGNLHRVLWTGGWDSTYRIVELSRKSVAIQPVYCIDPGRGSTEYEIRAMESITAALLSKPETKAAIYPLKIVKIEDIPQNSDITQAYKAISQKITLGSQYEWLARLAVEYRGIEIGIEKPNGEYSGCAEAIAECGRLIFEDDAYVIDKNASSAECARLFGNFRFPVIDKTETQMVENVKSWGCEDVMRLIWFCHSPINGLPCGYCRPCQQKMECSMQWLLPDKAKKRYRTFKKLSKISPKLATKISNLIYRKFK